MSRRTERVSDLLRDEISSIISRDMKDPRLAGGLLSVTEVEVSPDFSHAVVFVSFLGEEQSREDAFRAINSAGPFIHRELRQRLSLRRTPHLTFRKDDSIERGVRLSHLIDEVTHPPERA